MADNVESVIAIDERFKMKLGIGEDAYDSLKRKKNLTKYIGTAGAGVAGGAALYGSSTVASMFSAPGLLGLLGFGAATTPIGWVVAGGLASSVAAYGLIRYVTGQSKKDVDVVPKFINTPKDVLASAIFYFWAALNLKVAFSDRKITAKERKCIRDYFVEEWGYSKKFVRGQLPEVEKEIESLDIEKLTEEMIEFKKNNRDCNYDTMADELRNFLYRTWKSDGNDDNQGLIIVKWIEDRLNEEIW